MYTTYTLSLLLAFAVSGGQTLRPNAASHPVGPEPQRNPNQAVLQDGSSFIKPMKVAGPYLGKEIDLERRAKWTVRCDSEEEENPCINAIHGLPKTFWQTNMGTIGAQNPDPLPHTITINLGAKEYVNAIRMTPPSGANSSGAVAGHKVYLSLDNEAWGDPVAFGTWFEDTEDKFANFEPQQAQFVRLQATSATMKTQFIRIAKLSVWSTNSSTLPPPELGRWGPTIDFPLVPVGVFIDPPSGKVISFSSYAHDKFSQDGTDKTTLTATWDPTTEIVSQRVVRNTKHDMFWPGMAFDVDGRMVISGGETSYKSSIYNPEKEEWEAAGLMNIARGYQGSTTCGDGRIFVIGGSWSPDAQKRGSRSGEIFDPKIRKWSVLDNCSATPIETTEDWEKLYRADNHIWLQGWKDKSVFHAGPAKDMHWITINGEKAAILDAGRRGTDRDAMCGVAAMYDAVDGKILAAGGAPQYKYKDKEGVIRGSIASNNSFIITLGKVNNTVDVKTAGGGMNYKRIFHHAVILPNGETFVVGGQIEGQAFTDTTAQLVPEIYSPTRDTWTAMAPHSIIRTYHSFGLLLADATVLVGGGGLCGVCKVNHFDAQIYTPPYLLTSNGDLAERPLITEVSPTSVRPGDSLIITSNSDVTAASLVRYGGATHGLNNDQRRIELKLQKSNKTFQHSASIPSDGGIAIPGYWMLFIFDASGVPSKAKNVQIQVA